MLDDLRRLGTQLQHVFEASEILAVDLVQALLVSNLRTHAHTVTTSSERCLVERVLNTTTTITTTNLGGLESLDLEVLLLDLFL